MLRFYPAQPPPPSKPEELGLTAADEFDAAGSSQARHGTRNIEQNEQRVTEHRIGEQEDCRPKLVPGVMLSLSALGAEAIMAFAEEVHWPFDIIFARSQVHSIRFNPCTLAKSCITCESASACMPLL